MLCEIHHIIVSMLHYGTLHYVVCLHECMYVYIDITCMNVSMFMQICMNIYVYVYIYVYVCTNMFA